MKIIVIGAGKIGKIIIEYLAGEGMDITVIDSKPQVIKEVVEEFDVYGIVGNGASYDIQAKAGVKKCDIMIATTAGDELNILCCLVGKKNGVVHTIARVRNPDYTKQMEFMDADLGLDMIINPELEAAREIARILEFPSAIRIDSFASGKAEIVELKIDAESMLIGKSLSKLRAEIAVRFLVCAVVRAGSVYIPSGDFILKENDNIHITGSKEQLAELFRKLKIYRKRIKHIMIVGGSRISYYLGQMLRNKKITVKIIEKDQERSKMLGEQFESYTIMQGDGTNQDLLLEEGIKNTDALISLTGNDEENIIVSLYAKTLNVPKVITKVNRFSSSGILENLNLGTIVAPKVITADQILRYVRSLTPSLTSQVKTIYKLVNNEIEAAEFYISAPMKCTDTPFKDLKIKKDILIACIIRNGEVIIPDGMSVLKQGDSVITVSGSKLKNLEDILK